MSINQDFLNVKQLDVENKLIEPTHQLMAQLNSQFTTFYKEIKSIARELHNDIAMFSKQAYEQPAETFTTLYDQSVQECNEIYALFREQVVPKVELVSEQVTTKLMDMTEQTKEFAQALLDNPQETINTSVDGFSAAFNTGLEASQMLINGINEQLSTWFSVALEVTEENALSLYYACGKILKLLLEQPWETVQALFYNTLSSLLELYFQAVSALISLA